MAVFGVLCGEMHFGICHFSKVINRSLAFTVGLQLAAGLVATLTGFFLPCREGKTAEEEMKAWTFWHHRQHSVKQRILDADTKNSMGEDKRNPAFPHIFFTYTFMYLLFKVWWVALRR